MNISDKEMEDYARDCVRLAQLANNPLANSSCKWRASGWRRPCMSPQGSRKTSTFSALWRSAGTTALISHFTEKGRLMNKADAYRANAQECQRMALDGEAVACGADGISSFDRIRYRRHDADVFMWGFSLIELDGDDLAAGQ